jgi:phospholipid transport system substrate-binding protein
MNKHAPIIRCLFILLFTCFALQNTKLGAQEIDAAEARADLEQAIEQMLDILRKPEYKNPQTRPELEQQIEAAVFGIFDFTAFAAGTVGPRWRTFSADERSRMTEAFTDLLRATYLGQLENYDGEQILYTGEAVRGNHVEVSTVLQTTDNKQISIIYRMLKRDRWMVFDVVAEGMSLVQNYRSQFQDALVRETPDQLIARIEAQTERIRARQAGG